MLLGVIYLIWTLRDLSWRSATIQSLESIFRICHSSGVGRKRFTKVYSKVPKYLRSLSELMVDLGFLKSNPRNFRKLEEWDSKITLNLQGPFFFQEFIEALHNLHEEWLMERKFPVTAPVLVRFLTLLC